MILNVCVLQLTLEAKLFLSLFFSLLYPISLLEYQLYQNHSLFVKY